MTVQELDREIALLSEEALRLALIKESFLSSHKLDHFVPNPKQYKFFEECGTRMRAGFCGNRFGKSTIGVVEDCCWLLGERPFFPENHPLRRMGIPTPGVKGLVVAEDWDKVHEIFTNAESADRPGKFFEFLPADVVKGTTKTQKGQINSITVKVKIDGRDRESIIIFDTVRSYWNNPRSFESSDWDFIHLDEPVPQELWTAVSRGLLDRGGHSWWLLTPLGFPWMYEHMIAQQVVDPRNHWYFEASMDDNPLLDETAKRLYLESLPEDERQCRQDGKPLAHGRRVYGHFDIKRHIWGSWIKQDPKSEVQIVVPPPKGWKDLHTPPANYCCGYSLDPHPQTPHAVLFTAIAPNGDVYFYDELFDKCLIRELATKIIAKAVLVNLQWQLCDPSAWIENPDTGRCWADTLHENGLFVIRASKDKSNGIMQTQEIWSPTRKTNVYVMPHMTTFLKEIKSYFFDRENKPVDKNDHIMECLYRTVVHDNLTFRAPLKVEDTIYAKDEFNNTSSNYNLDYQQSINI